MQDDKEAGKAGKCRIPQPCTQDRNRRPKPLVALGQTSRVQKPKSESKPTTPVCSINRVRSRPTTGERHSLSTHVDKSEAELMKKEILIPAIPSKLLTFPKKELPSYMMSKNNPAKTVITVPLIQNKCVLQDIKSEEPNINQLKQDWLQMNNLLEKYKSELEARQTNISELYDSMKSTHKRMIALGHMVPLPGDLGSATSLKPSLNLLLPQVNNILITKPENMPYEGQVMINLNRLYEIPLNLVAVCEKSLSHNNNMIDWLNSVVKSKSKEIKINNLVTKITNFNDDNEMLRRLLMDVKTNYLEKVDNAINISRMEINNMTMHIQNNNNSYATPHLKSSNNFIEKDIHRKVELYPCNNNLKLKIDELEGKLEQEKYDKTILEGRCIKAESDLNNGVEENRQLQNTLDKARSITKTLEQRVQKLEYEIESIQNTFDEELKALNNTLNEKNKHIFDVTSLHDKLQLEKDDLENQFDKSRQYQQECLEILRDENEANANKYNVLNEKYNIALQHNNVLESKIASLVEELKKLESLNKELSKVIKLSDIKLKKAEVERVELVDIKINLKNAQQEISDYAAKLQDKCDQLEQNQMKINEIIKNVESLEDQNKNKNEYIEKLENKHRVLEQDILENEEKMEKYELQLTMLKHKLNEFQQEFQQMPSLKDLQETIYKQDSKLMESRKEKIELIENFESEIDQKNTLIKELLNKQKDYDKQKWSLETEMNKKILENNIVSYRNSKLTNKIYKNEDEIQNLMKSFEDSKIQIYNLEKIVLALHEPSEKLKIQQKKDHERILYLKEKLSEYKLIIKQTKKSDFENMNKIFDTFENELNIKPIVVAKHSRNNSNLKNVETFECHDNGSSIIHDRSTKIQLDKIVKNVPNVNNKVNSRRNSAKESDDSCAFVYSKTKIRDSKIYHGKNNAFGDIKNYS